MRSSLPAAVAAIAAIAFSSLPAAAQAPTILQEIGIDQRLGEPVPLEIALRDETGKEVRLGDFFGRQAVVLALVYYECPMLCTEVLNGLLRALRALSFDVGTELAVVTVSFDPEEGPELAAQTKRAYLARYNRPGAERGWHFLTGSPEAIERLTRSVGFRYAADPRGGQFAHASALMVLTPEGRLSRYLYGIEYAPRDLRLALVEASSHQIGSPVDQLLLYCFHYDPTTGKYGLIIMNVLRLAGLATVAGIGGLIALLLRRERRAG